MQKKTPDYTLRAIDKYHKKFDRVVINLPKGTKEWIRNNTGKSCNQFFNDLYTAYREQISGKE